MYRVLICENNASDAAKIMELTDGILKEICNEYKLSIVSSGAELLKQFCNCPDAYDLVLLDILMDEPNGMQAAKRMRQEGCNIPIIFLTSAAGFAVEGYEVRAIGYLIKPVNREKLKVLLEQNYTENVQGRYLLLEQRSQQLRIPVNEIVYLETSMRRTAIYLLGEDKPILHTELLSELLLRLPAPKFKRCHKSYAVNLTHTKMLRRYELTTTTGAIVPVSKAYYNEIKQNFLKSLNLV